MKKVFLFASAAIAALAMVSCNKEIEIQDQIAEGICPDGYYVEELVAEYPHDSETRTAFNETTGKFAWTEGDELAFHLSNGTYTSAPIDPATSKVKLYLPVGVTRDNYAVYPASAVVEEAATVGNMQVTLPSTYDISDNLTTEFVPMPLIATNDADNKKLKFEHVGALLQVNLNVPAGVKTAKLSMGKTITGTFDLAAGSGNGVIEAGEVSDDALTFVLSEGGLAAESTVVKLLAPLPSGTYEKFRIDYDNGAFFEKDLSASPWNFERTQGKKVSIAEENIEDPRNYFWIEGLSEVSKFWFYKINRYNTMPSNVLMFSKDNKKTWEPVVGTISLNQGERAYFYGMGNWESGFQLATATSGTRLAVGGDILTLLNRDGGELFYGCFQQLFCYPMIVDASELILPDYTAPYCYTQMFGGVYHQYQTINNKQVEIAPKILEHGPKLPARVLADGCYQQMFYFCGGLSDMPDFTVESMGIASCNSMFTRCESLTKTPMIMAPGCTVSQTSCQNMYRNCISLTEINDLPFGEISGSGSFGMMFMGCTSLVTPMAVLSGTGEQSFYGMFESCTSLESIPRLEAEILDARCYYSMFQDCTSLIGPITLTANVLGEESYREMFYGCTALESISINAVDVSAAECMMLMFHNCTGLRNIEVHFNEWPETYSCLSGWVSGITNTTGSFKKPEALETVYNTSTGYLNRVGDNHIPRGWTVYNLEEVEAGN